MSQTLPEWANQLLQSLEIDPVAVDIAALQTVAHNINDDPQRDYLLVGFIAGYAAGLAEGGGMAPFDKAHAASVGFMRKNTSRE
ncbi:hypothetical protein [Yaniella halotolerans]|uniref:hypothetical protein n=1 Tax=Yaniella halotolerans TaxID=225453 RepID=UPI0003B32AC2|nr:hypothetical protein [Yaniella halotolerans]